ncbi:MAG: histidine phosphatase family protein [Patescibacteria group bacterium]
MKTVYLVRHGESEANAGFPTYQAETSKLTERGIAQARFIAKRCEKLPIDVCIASTAVRSQETARIVGSAIGQTIEVEEVFTERRLPEEMIGMSRSDKKAQELELRWLRGFYEEGIRLGNGENFSDLKLRGASALKHLEDRSESNILVVTHGFFLRMIVACVIHGESLTPREFERFAQGVSTHNTGLTVLKFGRHFFQRLHIEPRDGWVLDAWNDHAHLG